MPRSGAKQLNINTKTGISCVLILGQEIDQPVVKIDRSNEAAEFWEARAVP